MGIEWLQADHSGWISALTVAEMSLTWNPPRVEKTVLVVTWLGDCGQLDGKRRERKHQWVRRWTQTFAVSSIFGEAKDLRADSEYP